MSDKAHCSHSIVHQQTVPGYIVGTIMPIWSCCDCGARFNIVPELPAAEPKPSHLHEKLAERARERDEARAEVDRLSKILLQWDAEHAGLNAEVERLRAAVLAIERAIDAARKEQA